MENKTTAYLAALQAIAHDSATEERTASMDQVGTMRVLADEGDALAAVVVDAHDLTFGINPRWERSEGWRADVTAIVKKTETYRAIVGGGQS